MKKLTLLITAVIFSISMSAQDPHWNTDGNASTSPINDFVGTTDNADLRFRTFDTFRMTLTSPTGWLGLNIAAPDMMFHVDDGGILSTGTTGTNPDLGAGTRMMWLPDQAAFRAGGVTGAQWDGTNVGIGSVAFGSDNTASGDYAIATGFQNTVDGESSQALGASNDVDGECSSAIGGSNTVMQNASTAIGKSNVIEASDALSFGIRNVIASGATGAISLGRQTKSVETNNMIIGSGASIANPLLNDISQSIVMGMNSDVPTVFIETSDGVGTFGNVGIGNITSPTEVLDVRGTARLREMEPAGAPDVVITGMEGDEEGDYVLHFSNLEDIGDCTWDKVNGDQDLATGFTDACVERHVLIGTDQPITGYKVHMVNAEQPRTLAVQSIGNETQQYASFFSAEGGTIVSNAITAYASGSPSNFGVAASAGGEGSGGNTGVRGNARDGDVWNRGVHGVATRNSNLNYGVYGEAYEGNPNPRQKVGVYGSAYDYSLYDNFGGYFRACDSENNIGVYATVCGETGGVAGYFTGAVLDTQSPISLSDETIKTGINEMENPLEIISQLQPKEYYFNTSEYPHLNLKSTKSYGFSAQQVQELLPEVVEEVHHPAQFDTLGELISPSEDLLGIRYQEFIAILTAGIKEQQVEIDEHEQTIDDLQQSLNNQNDLIAQMMDQMDALTQQVNNCCNGGLKFNPMDKGHGDLNNKPSPNGNVLEQNVPNPFRSQTTISYKLEQGGKVLLNIFDKTGKPITTLVEAEQSAGDYRYEWDASGLPAGLYHYALYVDGELLVKKAIKLQD